MTFAGRTTIPPLAVTTYVICDRFSRPDPRPRRRWYCFRSSILIVVCTMMSPMSRIIPLFRFSISRLLQTDSVYFHQAGARHYFFVSSRHEWGLGLAFTGLDKVKILGTNNYSNIFFCFWCIFFPSVSCWVLRFGRKTHGAVLSV
ncbi:hypothetical protein F5Y15DRAFT_179421 [Xylariaceae sp. FL0016]|nr:hypothetical protein F5Y15DRAFT_179421 [Xylariaceae sp. FL0016]